MKRKYFVIRQDSHLDDSKTSVMDNSSSQQKGNAHSTGCIKHTARAKQKCEKKILTKKMNIVFTNAAVYT